AEAIFEIQDVVRDPEPVRHEPGVGDRMEGGARTVGDGVAVAEQLHGGADHVVTLLDEERRGDGGIHPAGHGDEDALAHRCKTADRALTFSTIFGRAPITVSMSSGVFSLPNENRSAATPRSRGTPIAVRTCDGSTAPVEQAEPEEQAIPARSRGIRRASLSVPGIDTLVTCGARRPFAALITASGTTASSRRSSSSRRAATRAANAACSRAASSTAAPNPTIPGTFSVPGRMPNCWPPPWMIASMTWRSRTTSADALGRADLVAGDGEEGACDVGQRDGDLAEGLHPVDVERDAGLATSRREPGDRLDHADLVVHPQHAHHWHAAGERLTQSVLPKIALTVHRQDDFLAPEPSHRVSRRQDCLVLDRRHR